MITPISAPSPPLRKAQCCTISPNTITFTFYSPPIWGRYYNHLSLCLKCLTSQRGLQLVYNLLLIIPALQGACLTCTYLSMNNQQHEKGLQQNTSCNICSFNCLQRGLVEMSAKTYTIGFLSPKHGLDGFVHVSSTHG